MRELMLLWALYYLVLYVSAQRPHWKMSWRESQPWNEHIDAAVTTNDTGVNATRGSTLIGGQPVYVSLTTLSSRLHLVANTLKSLIAGSVLPTTIYVFVSTEPYLLDEGISDKDIMNKTFEFVNLTKYFTDIRFVYTENIGPHRKLLPLLHHKIYEDCVIITVDDDHIYLKHWLRDMLAYYLFSNKQDVISSRARRIAVCSGDAPYRIAPYRSANMQYTQWYAVAAHVREMLLLPTGVGGILYRPRYFKKNVVFSRDLFAVTPLGDDLMFRLSTMAKGVYVTTACIQGDIDHKGAAADCPVLPNVDFSHITGQLHEYSHQVQLLAHQQQQQQKASHSYMRRRHDTKGNLRQHNVYQYSKNGSRRPTVKYSDVGKANEATQGCTSFSSTSSHSSNNSNNSFHSSTTTDPHIHHSTSADIISNLSSPSSLLPIVTGRDTTVSPNMDFRVQGALSQLNSICDNNFHMWTSGVEVLRSKEWIDVNKFIQDFVYQERNHCVMMRSLVHHKHDTVGGRLIGEVAHGVQNVYEYFSHRSQCAIVRCLT
mmetsp:Transcript_29492/g.49389  ORF Transcript_29492/g.49389 Transcript_29492/m.49389 type:complete len:541 (-) Transcript_29492:1696-3318(-)